MIEEIPLPADSVDVVISNCVINLSVDKAAVLTEIARVLKPGGRIGISDIVAEDQPLARRAGRAWQLRRLHRRRALEGRIRGRARGGGLRAGRVEFTHEVADGMHGAIVKAVKTSDAGAKGLPVIQPAASGGLLLMAVGAATLVIDDLRPEHWPEVARIYAEGIATGDATFETTVPDWEAWDATHLPDHRFVALIDGRVVGWAAVVGRFGSLRLRRCRREQRLRGRRRSRTRRRPALA